MRFDAPHTERASIVMRPVRAPRAVLGLLIVALRAALLVVRPAVPAAVPLALLLAMLLAVGVTLWLPSPARAADPELAAAGSLLLPGVGQALNGDYGAGAVQATLYLGLLSAYGREIDKPDYIPFDEREDEATRTIRINRTSIDADLLGVGALNLAFYSAYAAYRDARADEAVQATYATPAPRESLTDLALAPYRWEHLSRPTTIAPLLVPLFLLLAPTRSEQLVFEPDDSITRSELGQRFYVLHSAVAIGEESFFRGFLNNGLSDALGPNWGLAASSTIFGLGHQGEAGQATAIGAGLFGAYLGWLQQRNDYSIGQGVAIHFWWNFLVSLTLLKQHENAVVTPFSVQMRF